MVLGSCQWLATVLDRDPDLEPLRSVRPSVRPGRVQPPVLFRQAVGRVPAVLIQTRGLKELAHEHVIVLFSLCELLKSVAISVDEFPGGRGGFPFGGNYPALCRMRDADGVVLQVRDEVVFRRDVLGAEAADSVPLE